MFDPVIKIIVNANFCNRASVEKVVVVVGIKY